MGIYMITYKTCSNENTDLIFEAFMSGFSDYMIKFEFTKERFMQHFFMVEGNELKYSVLALDDSKPIGLVLGGISTYEGKKTLRCGALCVDPKYRNQGVAGMLFKAHYQIGVDNDCEDLFLEVIQGNNKAINFYEKNGYEIRYDIHYYSHANPLEIDSNLEFLENVKRISYDAVKSLYDETKNIHICYQNTSNYMSKISSLNHFGFYVDDKLIGGITISNQGKIFFLYVNEHNRNKGIARALIKKVVMELECKRLVINYASSIDPSLFLDKLGFKKDLISQHEMYKAIKG